MTISLIDCKRYYEGLPHQKGAVEWMGTILLNTPAKSKLGLTTRSSWLNMCDPDLEWLQKQISQPTLDNFAKRWRNQSLSNVVVTPKAFSQRDNSINPDVSCNSTAHAMLVDYHLRKRGLLGFRDDEDFLKRVYSGNYGKFGSNNSLSWDVQMAVCNSYGVRARYSNEGLDEVKNEIKKNGVTCVNIFHKGSTPQTRSGGHVILLAGYDEVNKLFRIHDPWGARPSDGYQDKKLLKYDMPESEMRWRFQGIHTELTS